MELKMYLEILKRRALVIVIVAAVTVSVVAAAGLLTPPVYTARATVRVILDAGILDFRLWGDHSKRLLNTYSYIVKSGPFLEEAINRLSPRTSSLEVSDLRQKAEAELVPDTELIVMTVQDGDPVLARDLVNTLAILLVEHAQNLYVGSSKSTRQIVAEQLASIENQLETDRQQLTMLLANGAPSAEIEALRNTIEFEEDSYDWLLDRYEVAQLNESLRANSVAFIEPASLPTKPSNALGLKEIGLGLIVGLFGGVGLALVIENLDTHIHSHHQLEHLTNLPVLGAVPRGILSLDSSHRTNGTDNVRPIEEAYRLLSTNLQALREEHPIKTVLITSAIPKEGKSTVAANLAQTLAERGQTVFLVESDMRHPIIEKVFGIDNGLGLSNLLAERTALSGTALGQVMYPTEQPSLFVIGGGPEVPNPTALLASPLMEKLLDYLGAQGQITLLDAPPVLGMADVSVLAPMVDGVILVVRQAQAKREQVLGALKQLQACRTRVIGTIFLTKRQQGVGLL